MYVNVRRDRKSRSYMQDIFRHAKTTNYFSFIINVLSFEII